MSRSYDFYRDLEQFNEKAVGVFSWFENVQLAIGLGAKIDEWRRRRLFKGTVWARAGRRGAVMRNLSCPEEL